MFSLTFSLYAGGNFDKALGAQSKGYYFEAIQYYRLELKRHPENHQARSNMAVSLFQVNDLKKAEMEMKRSLKGNPFSVDSNYNLGLMLKKLGRFKEAITRLEYAKRLRPSFFESYSQLADLYEKVENYAHAESTYSEMLKMKPKNPSLLFKFANFLVRATKYLEADKRFVQVLGLAGTDFNYNFAYALFLDHKIDRSEEAIKRYKIALKLKPGHVDSRLNLSLRLAKAGKVDEAKKNLKKLIGKYAPKSPHGYFHLGRLYKDESHYKKAIGLFNKAIALDPGGKKPYEEKASIYVVQKKYDLAAAQYLSISNFDPKYIKSYLFRGWAFETMGNPQGALSLYQEAQQISPLDLDVNLSLGNIYFTMNRKKEAITAYSKVLSIVDTHELARYRSGVLNFKMGDYDASKDHFEKIASESKFYQVSREYISDKSRLPSSTD